jgi:multiple sugar transport system ATP-binding protein
MASVQFANIRKGFGVVEIIRGVSVDIDDGEFVVLVGPSGCGKSTVLRMLAGLEEVTSGEIRIGGRIVNDVAPKDRDIAMVFQSYALYPHMTVGANMSFALKLAGASQSSIDEKVNRAASILALDKLLDRFPRQLSGGQRQRVAMGRAIVRDPKVFLFDEPLSNLDAKLRVQMRAEIRKLHDRLKTTTVYVTHDQVEAMTMADKIVVLQGGVVEQVGRPLELYDRPANLFVASFIGSPGMNLIAGRIHVNGSISLVTEGGKKLPLSSQVPAAWHDRQATIGIRPEDFTIDAAAGVPAQIILAESTGAETQVSAKLAGQEIVGVFRERLDARPGDEISLGIKTSNIHIFDSGSGLRLN